MCDGLLQEISDKLTINVCEKDPMHKFIINVDNILWVPIVDLDSEDAPLHFKKFTLDGKEVFDKETNENLLAVINSLNSTIKEVISEYTSLGEYVKVLENKISAYKAASEGANVTLFGRKLNQGNVTPSGIILNK